MYRSERVLVVDESCSSPAEPARLTGHVLSPTRGQATLYAESAQKITATQRAIFARFGPDGKFIGSNGYGGGNYDAAPRRRDRRQRQHVLHRLHHHLAHRLRRRPAARDRLPGSLRGEVHAVGGPLPGCASRSRISPRPFRRPLPRLFPDEKTARGLKPEEGMTEADAPDIIPNRPEIQKRRVQPGRSGSQRPLTRQERQLLRIREESGRGGPDYFPPSQLFRVFHRPSRTRRWIDTPVF